MAHAENLQGTFYSGQEKGTGDDRAVAQACGETARQIVGLEFRAFFAYHYALMERPGNLTKAEREMIVVATSSSNQCQYCVVAHGAILRIRAKNPLISAQVAVNYRKADITERQKAMLDFALKVSRSAETVGEADFDALKDIWDIAAIAAFFGLSNRMANVTAMRPNAEFYTMGRG